MATSSSLSSTLNYASCFSFEVFPYPVYVNVEDSVHIKLSRPNYFIWRKMMSDFLERQYLIGFINGMIKPPPALIAVDEQSACRGKEIENPDHISWKRTDELVQKWLRSTIQDDILCIVADLKTAHAIWRVLEDTFFNPSADYMENELMMGETSSGEAGINIGHYFPLYQAVQESNWERVKKFLEKEPDAIKARINTTLQTPLMVAVKSPHRNKVVKGLLERMSEEDLEQFEHRKEKTVLHKAVAAGNIEAAKMLVNKNPRLPYICGDSGVVPLRTAALRANREMVSYLLSVTKEDTDPRPFNKLGFELIDSLIIGGFYDIALTLIRRHPELAVKDSRLLDRLALKSSAFPSGLALNFCQRFIYSYVPTKLENPEKLEKQQCGGDIESSAQCSTPVKLRMRLLAMVWKVAEIFVPQIKHVREKKEENQYAVELVRFLCMEVGKLDHLKAKDMLKVPLSTAAREGIREVVEEILYTIPGSTRLRILDGKSVFHVAVSNRREQVFNLIYQYVGSPFTKLSQPDIMRNNGLHIAGYLYPQQLLNLRAAGAALQMQLELQWFKEVEKFVLPQAREEKNDSGQTPAEVFTETHKILVKEGEQWMKDAANSCTIVAALVATVAFAAAITVPGGNNDVTGLPLFSKETAFVIFAIADALALFSSTSSLLMFLSILTSRYAEEDFLYTLPNRLIIGLITLFLSILSMMTAFVSTLYLVFAAKDTWIFIPVVVLACGPVILFVSLQFPLLFDMIKSTYGPGIFGKQSNRFIT